MTKPTPSLLWFGWVGLLSGGGVACLSLEPLGSYAEGEPAASLAGADAPLETGTEAADESSTEMADAGAPARQDAEAVLGEGALDPATLELDPSVAAVASCAAPGEFLDAAQLVCYRRGTPAAAWLPAQESCESWGGQLVSIGSREEDDFLTARVEGRFWIGVSDRLQEGRMLDGEGQPPAFTNWAAGQPDDFQGREDCAAKQESTGLWNDLPCRSALTYVCERAQG